MSDGEMVKRCAVEMAKAFGYHNMVSLSSGTENFFDIQTHVDGKLKQVMHDCKYFSLALDESTDVTDTSQLLIFTRAIDNSFEVHGYF